MAASLRRCASLALPLHVAGSSPAAWSVRSRTRDVILWNLAAGRRYLDDPSAADGTAARELHTVGDVVVAGRKIDREHDGAHRVFADTIGDGNGCGPKRHEGRAARLQRCDALIGTSQNCRQGYALSGAVSGGSRRLHNPLQRVSVARGTQVRVLFVADETDELEVRRLIEKALRSARGWSVLSSGPRPVRPSERALAARLSRVLQWGD